ncbi:MAG: ATP-binding protein, partial [Bosea sp. (in: a-proteobacteria)]
VVPQSNGELAIQRIGRDVTARVASTRALDEARTKAEDASEAKSRFLATVSHEFRTPLNGILGMADLLDDTGPTPEQDTYVRALRTSGEALLALVDDILDFSKVEAGKLELAEAPFDLPLLAESVVELMAPRAQAKGIELSACLAPDLPLRVLGDADRLRQILLNIVGNAVKFTQVGGVGVTLRLDGERLLVEVSDTGPGIAADRQDAIFEEFEQADNGAMPHSGGTGLGLAIVRRLVALMGGTVSVESQLGCGATFRLALPLVTLASESATPEMPDWSGRKALVVSGTPFMPGHLAQMLALTGAEVLLAKDHHQAEPLLAANTDLMAVLIDHALGADVARELAQLAGKHGKVRTIILLSPQERRSLGSPASAGFDGFLVKPLRARSLYQRLGSTEAHPQPTRDSATMPASTPAPKLRVLVAEDNEINALLMTRTLERLGCLPVWARDGREALLLAEASLSGAQPAFDLVLMDVRMPGLDGLSAARLIRAAEQAAAVTSRLIILAVSANVAETDRRAALAAGMDDCLGKPLTREAL